MMVPMRLLVVLEHPKSVINIQKNGNSALPLAESMTLTLTNSFLIIQERGGAGTRYDIGVWCCCDRLLQC